MGSMNFYKNHLQYLEATRTNWTHEIRYTTNEANRLDCQRLLRNILTQIEIEGGEVTQEEWQLARAARASKKIDLSMSTKRIELK